MRQNATVLDAATRFLRTNPALLDLAVRGASESGVAVEILLADTVRRVRRSGFDAVANARGARGPGNRAGRSSPPDDDRRPHLVVLAAG